MSWTIGLHVGEAFAEVAGRRDDQIHRDRWLLPQQSLTKGLQAFADKFSIEKPQKVFLSDRFIHHILTKRLGSAPAFLVTNGFENWLEMSLTVMPKFFTVKPFKQRSPLNRDLTFGISERTRADGAVEKQVDIEELEFLATKLELSQVKAIAVGLLHSQKNPQNELQVVHFFREKGFRVFSSLLPEGAHHGLNERERWWRAILNAYVSPSVEDLKKTCGEQIHQALGEQISIIDLFQCNDAIEPDYLQFLDPPAQSLLNSVGKQADHLIYFGLDSFYCLHLKKEWPAKWLSDWGWVAGRQPATVNLHLQPTQKINKSFWGFAAFDVMQAGYEPGPMCLGKGLNPLLLDVLYDLEMLSSVEGLNEKLQDKAKPRIRESLSTYVREQEFVVQTDEIAELLKDGAMMNMALQIDHLCGERKVVLAGPLAKVFAKILRPYMTKSNIELLKPYDFLLSDALVTGQT